MMMQVDFLRCPKLDVPNPVFRVEPKHSSWSVLHIVCYDMRGLYMLLVIHY